MRRAALIAFGCLGPVLAGCAGPAPPAPPIAARPVPPARADLAVVIAIRPVPRATLGRKAAAFGLAAPAPGALPAEAEFVLRDADGKTSALIAPRLPGLRAGARVRLIDRGRLVALMTAN